MRGKIKHYDVKIETKTSGTLEGEFTKKEVLDIQRQMQDKNTDELVIGIFEVEKKNVTHISVKERREKDA